MKLYIKSAVYDKKGEDLKKANVAKKEQMKEDEIRRLVEQGVSKSEFAGHEISKFEIKGNFIEFELDGVGSPKGYTPEISVYFKRNKLYNIPESVSEELNQNFESGYLKPKDEVDSIQELARKAKDDINNVVNELMSKYDADGYVKVRDNNIFYESDEPVLSFIINFNKFLGVSRDIYSWKYEGYSFYDSFDIESESWWLEKPYKYNRSNIAKGFEKLADSISKWKNIIDNIDVDKVADDIEYQLKSFESKYKSRFPGLEMSNLKVNAIVPDSSRFLFWSTNYEFSFDLEAYDGEIDITIEMTLDDLKEKTLEDRLINIIKYRKRKYGLH